MKTRELKRRLAPLLRTPLQTQWLLRAASCLPLGGLTGAVPGLLIPVVNLVGRLLGRKGADSPAMPHPVQLVCGKFGHWER